MTNVTPPDDDDDFGAMLEESLRKTRRVYKIAERVKATVVQIGAERIILDLGDGQDALMELSHVADAVERGEVREGAVIEAYVLGFENRVVELGSKPGRMGGGNLALEDAKAAGLPVSGTVLEVNKGGFVVDVGGTRCFCPLGAMDTRRIDDPSVMLGKRLEFLVTEYKGPRDVVLSRRKFLAEEGVRLAAETREKLAVGARMKGTVVNIRDFGAFVDLGGVEGLVPASELGYGRARPQDAVTIGQEVEVEVMRMETGEDGRQRLSLSMRALQADPFHVVSHELTPGTIVAGRVMRVEAFGAFVEIVPGVEGLVHVSAFGKRIGHPSDVVKAGQIIAVGVEGLDPETRRISLRRLDDTELDAPAQADEDGLRVLRRVDLTERDAEGDGESVDVGEEREREARVSETSPTPAAPAPPPRVVVPRPRVGDIFDVTVDKAEKFGVFVHWPSGSGLVPGRELGVPQGADMRKQFPSGMTFRAVVINIRDDGKIALSRTAVEKADERAETEAYMSKAGPGQTKGLGTLGEMMQDKRRR